MTGDNFREAGIGERYISSAVSGEFSERWSAGTGDASKKSAIKFLAAGNYQDITGIGEQFLPSGDERGAVFTNRGRHRG